MISAEKNLRRNFILSRLDDMHSAKRPYSDNWPKWEKVWKMVEEGKSGEDAWRADLPDTYPFATIKTAQAAFVDSKVIPTIIRHEDDPTSKAQDLKDLYVDIAEKGNQDQELYFTRLDAFKLGTAFTKTIYVKETRTVYDIEKFNPKTGEFKWKEREINDFDDPKTLRVSPYLVLLDDLARADWNTCRDLAELEVMGKNTAERLYPDASWNEIKGANELLQELKAQSSTKIANSSGVLNDPQKPTEYHFFSPGFDWSNEVVEIVHYWNKEEDSYEVLINGHPYKVRTKKNPQPIPYIHKQIPYTRYIYSPYGGDEAWGAGIPEIGQAEVKALRTHREMMSDRQKLSLFSPAFSDVNDEIDQKNLKLKPLSVIRTKGGAPKQFIIPGITTSDLALKQDYAESYKRATGIDERILGVEAQGARMTATEVSFLREAALKRLREFAFLYKNVLLHGEIKLKFSLFKQYYSSPLARESKVKSDKATRILINKYKEFKVKSGNTYVRKEVTPNYFEGEVDTDLDLQLLLPMTQAQMVTMWSQILRDSVPFVQAGIIDISLQKVWKNYIEALGTSYESLKEDVEAVANALAEKEHKLLANPDTSTGFIENFPKGTQPPYLTEGHVKKHQDLFETDVHIDDSEKLKLAKHIEMDVNNFKTQVMTQPQPNVGNLQPQNLQALGGVGGIVQPQQSPQI